MLFSPNQDFILNGSSGYRHFLYDYGSVGLREAVLIGGGAIRAYKYITTNIVSSSRPGLNLEKGKMYFMTMLYKNSTSGSNNSFISLYINGALQGTNRMEFTPNLLGISVLNIGSARTNDMCGGAYLDFASLPKGCPANGRIDDVKIYSRALSDDEIKQHAKIAGF